MSITAKSWPFQEARNLLAHIEKKGKTPGDMVTFETGYGPSGAPHIGTFGEVVRTLWVMRAFRELTQDAYPVRLIMFSDDYDALRRVPDNMPEWMNEHLGKPLSNIPNPYPAPYDEESSFGAANNIKLVDFVDYILQQYDGSKVGSSPIRSRVSLVSSSEYYWAGAFNDMLDLVWDNYQAIQDVMLPTLGEDRRATYSPFMPVTPREWGPTQVLQVPVKLVGNREIQFMPPMYEDSLTNVTSRIHDGLVKLQWKVDWAMRWVHFDVDYEMSGKDLIDSVKASSKICRILGGTPPLNLTYELFLDEDGAKISKSKGNGFTVEDWLEIGTPESLMLFMFQNPRAAKKLYRDLVPQMEDQLHKMLRKDDDFGYDDPVWHFTTNHVRPLMSDISYSLLLNLAVVSQARDPESLMAYLEQSRSLGLDSEFAYTLCGKVIRYAEIKGLFDRARRHPNEQEQAAFQDLALRFSLMLDNMTAEHYQYQVYEVGKAHGFQPLRSWFQALYECLLGSSDGPRFGAFTEAYGLQNTIDLLRQYDTIDV